MSTWLLTEILQMRTPADKSNLGKLSGDELRFLCGAIGCPHSGTKAEIINNILNHMQVRLKLADHEDPDVLSSSFKKKELYQMAALVKIWKSGNKRQLACSLLNWRNRCRLIGRQYMADYRANTQGLPKQIQMLLPLQKPGETLLGQPTRPTPGLDSASLQEPGAEVKEIL